jgi:hypothetical protein
MLNPMVVPCGITTQENNFISSAIKQFWNPAEFGFDCSFQEIERFLDARDNAALLAELRKEANIGQTRQKAA